MTIESGQTYRATRNAAGNAQERGILWPTPAAPTLAQLYWSTTHDAMRTFLSAETSPAALAQADQAALEFNELYADHPVFLFEDSPHLARLVSITAARNIEIGGGTVGLFFQFSFVDIADDPVQGITFPSSSANLRGMVAPEVYVITNPGGVDSDGTVQAQVPNTWDPIPGQVAQITEAAILKVARLTTQPSIPEGTVANVSTSDGVTETVNLPAFPSREVLQGVMQGVVFSAETADRTFTIDGDRWSTVTALQLGRLRYQVVLERRRLP